MKKFKIKRMPTQQNVYLKGRIAKNRSRAKWVGMTYFLSALLIAVAACFPLLEADAAHLGVAEFWKGFAGFDIDVLNDAESILPFTVSFLYAIMLIVLALNVLRGLLKFRGLFRKKASRKYGFNLNAVQMHGMGGVFSNVFASVLAFHFLFAVLCPQVKGTPLFLIVTAFGTLIHFLCGLRGGKASIFEVDEYGKMVERKREIGRVAPFFRNFFQLLSTFVMMWLFLRTCRLDGMIASFFQEDTWEVYVRNNFFTFASMFLQVLTGLSLIALLKHATGIVEYDIDGTQAAGMKNFRVFAFFVMLTSFATFVCRLSFGEGYFSSVEGGGTVFAVAQWKDTTSLFLGSVALGMFILEVVMRNMPADPNKEENAEDFYESRDGKEEGDDFYDRETDDVKAEALSDEKTECLQADEK